MTIGLLVVSSVLSLWGGASPPPASLPPIVGKLEEVRPAAPAAPQSARPPAQAAGLPHVHGPDSPLDALERLKAGNDRVAGDRPLHPHCDPAWRRRTFREGQHPFAVIVSCSDSRVPVELILDQGIGDLFVIRVAGNVVADHEMGSIEYAAEHFGVPVVVILGHRDCGAVTAVVKHARECGHIPHLVEHIQPAVQVAERLTLGRPDAERVAESVRQNVWHGMSDLLTGSVMVQALVRAQRLMVVGAIYDLETARIEWLGEHPDQAGLIAETPAATRPPHSH